MKCAEFGADKGLLLWRPTVRFGGARAPRLPHLRPRVDRPSRQNLGVRAAPERAVLLVLRLRASLGILAVLVVHQIQRLSPLSLLQNSYLLVDPTYVNVL